MGRAEAAKERQAIAAPPDVNDFHATTYLRQAREPGEIGLALL